MSETKKNVKEKRRSIFDKIKSVKNIEIIFVAVLGVVVVLVMLNSFNFTTQEKNTEFSASGYVTQLESKMSKILSDLDGAGKVNIMITVESGMETVPSMQVVEKQVGGETVITTSPVIVGGKPIVLKEMYPKITGVLIVAQGADSIRVKLELLKATASVLSIEEKIIQIYTMK